MECLTDKYYLLYPKSAKSSKLNAFKNKKDSMAVANCNSKFHLSNSKMRGYCKKMFYYEQWLQNGFK